MLLTKECKACGGMMSRPPKITFDRWEARTACSKACAAKLRRFLPKVQCPSCMVEFQKTSWRDKYCSRNCAAKAHPGPAVVLGMHEKYVRVTSGERGRMLAHRLVMEQALGRPLVRGESVHHKNGDTKDNRPENLELWYRGQPAGQRVVDLIDYIAEHHAKAMTERLNASEVGTRRDDGAAHPRREVADAQA